MKKILYGMMAATMIFATSCENELEVGAAGEREVRLQQMGMPFNRDRGVELLREIYL